MTTTLSRKKSESSRGVSQWALAWRRLKKNKVAIAGLGVVGLFALFTAFDGWPFVLTRNDHGLFAIYPPECIPPACAGGSLSTNAPPSLSHPFGTGSYGYDVYSEIVYGTRAAFVIGLGATGFALAIAVSIGLAAGYFGGWLDNLLMRLTEVFLVIPFFLLLLVFLQIIIVLATLQIAASVLTEAAVSFLGFGAPNSYTWGQLMNIAASYINQAWWAITFPAIFLTLFVMGFNLLGNGLRDALDPRLRE